MFGKALVRIWESRRRSIEVDIAKAFGDYLGREVEIINTDFSMLIPALETGEADIIICDMTVNEERKEVVDFSEPYLYGRTLALVGKDFAVRNNVTDEMKPEDFFAIKDARYVGLAGTISVSVPQSYGIPVEEITDVASGLMEINNGTADVFVGANTIDPVLAVPYDIPVKGYRNNTVNSLRLWSAKPVEDFDLSTFNQGHFLKAMQRKSEAESISQIDLHFVFYYKNIYFVLQKNAFTKGTPENFREFFLNKTGNAL